MGYEAIQEGSTHALKTAMILWLGKSCSEGPVALKPGPLKGSGEYRATEIGIFKIVIFSSNTCCRENRDS